jgi:5-methylthioadenosine/S-adenosylhomocysteine deaminase
MPKIDESLRALVIAILHEASFFPVTSGAYANAMGPRFETKAEIKALAMVGEVVGMTAAHECTACCELNLPYAMICMVDNYAHGISGNLTIEDFYAALHKNQSVVETFVGVILNKVPSSAYAEERVKRLKLSEEEGSRAGAVPASTVATVDLIVHARYVVPMVPGAEQTVLHHHSIVVHHQKIVAILPTTEVARSYSALKTVDVSSHHAVMPGLVDAHTHLGLNLLKGYADDFPLATWLTEYMWPAEGKFVSSEFVRAGTKAAIAELIKGGVTSVNEMYWFPDAIAQVVEETGVRATIGGIVLEFPSAWASNAGEYMEKAIALEKAWKTQYPSGRVKFSLAPHAPYTVSDASFAKLREIQEELKCPMHVHLHETEGEVSCSCSGTPGPTKHMSDQLTSPLKNLQRLGLINSKLIAVHMTQLTDEEISTLAAANASVVHCPTSNLKLASGFCKVSQLVKAGVNVALGTDSSSSNNALDMFAEIKLAAILAKNVANDATSVPAWQALRMGTYNGAKAQCSEDVYGSLEPGKAADFSAVELHSIYQLPMYNVISQLVYATNRTSVTDVWVNGLQLLNNKQLTTINEQALKTEILEWYEKIHPTKKV